MLSDHQSPHGGSLSKIGLSPEALSNEVLQLKIGDLYQELETIKQRLAALEFRLSVEPGGGRPGPGRAPSLGTMSDPDRGHSS